MQQRREAEQVVESLMQKLLLLLLVLLTFNKQYGVQSQSSVTRLLSEQDTEVLLGSNATINCSVPTGTRSITWLLNGVVIAQNRNPYYSQYSIVGTDREFNLFVQNVSLNDNGKLSCQVRTNESRSSRVITSTNLHVLVPPSSIVVQPGSIARCVAGNRTQLTCVALLAKPAVTLTWMVGSDELLSCSPSSDDQVSDVTELDGRMNTSCSLTVLATRINHNKQYFCRATGKALPVPLLVHTRLDVLYAPEVELHVQPNKLVLQEDMAVSITCLAHSNPPPELWEWRVNSEKELHISGRTFVIDRLSRRHHNATVSCVVYNSIDAAKKSVVLQVEYPPKFVHPVSVLEATEGDSITLNCQVEANPVAELSWHRRDAHSSNNNNNNNNNNLLLMPELGNAHAVSIRVQSSTFGEYVCVARSARFAGRFESSVHVLRRVPPHVRAPAHVLAALRTPTHIPCVVDAVPQARVSWLRDGVQLPLDGKYSVSEEPFVGGVTSVLTIASADKQDFGEFNCSAVNELGVASQRIVLDRLAETNLQLAVGGSVGALVALVCILILSALILHQRRAKRSLKRASRQLQTTTTSNKPAAKATGNTSGGEQLMEPMIMHAPQHTNHKCIVFGNRTMYCASDSMQPPGGHASLRSSPFEQPWLNSSVDYLQQDSVDAASNGAQHPMHLQHSQNNMIISLSPTHCLHHTPITSITTMPLRHDDEVNVAAEEAKDDSSRSFDSGYGPGSTHANQQLSSQLLAALSNNTHSHHCGSLNSRFGRPQLATPCTESKLVIFPQASQYFVPHCFGPRPHDCLSSSNFSSTANSESPNPIWEHDAPTSYSGSSGTLNRGQKLLTVLPASFAMQSLCVPSHAANNNLLPESDENDNDNDNGAHESFNEVRASLLAKDAKQSRQYASVV